MPLKEVQDPLTDTKETQYVLFFASGTPSWCPDCREALPAIESVFGDEKAPLLQVTKVGLKDEWKSANNRWRGEPYHVNETPCIIKFINVRKLTQLSKA
jgi:thiol-disulfide isomerase/thioredoxin